MIYKYSTISILRLGGGKCFPCFVWMRQTQTIVPVRLPTASCRGYFITAGTVCKRTVWRHDASRRARWHCGVHAHTRRFCCSCCSADGGLRVRSVARLLTSDEDCLWPNNDRNIVHRAVRAVSSGAGCAMALLETWRSKRDRDSGLDTDSHVRRKSVYT